MQVRSLSWEDPLEEGMATHCSILAWRIHGQRSLWTVVHQAPLFMGFSRQEYWSGLSCPPPGDLPSSGIEPKSFKSLALADEFFTNSTTFLHYYSVNVRI